MAQWDVVVIGAGPAGLAAATAVAEQGLSCLVIDRMGCGGELMNLGPLHDCPDRAEGTAGPDLAATMMEAAMTAGAELGSGEVAALAGGTPWVVTTDEETHEARAVILATGLAPGRIGVEGEEGYEGQGLSHCAACDGPLYRNQPVMVVGSDRWARQEALDLAATCSAVTLVTLGEAVPPLAGVRVLDGSVVALEGAGGLEAVLVQQGGETERVPARGLFVQCNRRPALGFLPDGVALDASGHAVVDAALQCSMPLLFAVGDARAGSDDTVMQAVADGRQAATSATKALGKAAG